MIDKRPTPLLLVFSALSLLLLCLTGCAGSTQPVPEPVETSASEVPSAAERPLRIVLNEALPTLDPHRHLALIAYAVLGNIYESLVSWDAESLVEPGLAERWDTEDFRSWTFYLRPEARFHDGSPLTVDDVLFSLQRASAHPSSMVSGFLKSVERFEAGPEPGSVVLELVRADPFFLDGLVHVSIVPRGAPDEITEPVGSGPYRLVSYEAGRSIVLERFEQGPAPLPTERDVEFLIEADMETSVARLERGEVDLVYGLPATLVERVEQDAELWVKSRLGRGVSFLDLNMGREPFDDVRVRQAVDLALDREALVRDVTLNHSRVAGQLLTPSIMGHDPEIEPTVRDLEAARRLLAEAGFDAESPARFRLETTDAYAPSAEAVARQLGEAGFEVEVMPRDWPELYADLVAGKPTARLGFWMFDSADGGMYFASVTHSRSADGKWGGSSTYAPGTETDEALEAEIRSIFELSDPARRATRLKELNRRVTALDLRLPLLWPMELYGLQRRLQWHARSDGALRARDMVRNLDP